MQLFWFKEVLYFIYPQDYADYMLFCRQVEESGCVIGGLCLIRVVKWDDRVVTALPVLTIYYQVMSFLRYPAWR